MTIEERKQKTYEGLQLLEKDITRLQNNISELKQILEDIHTEEDIENIATSIWKKDWILSNCFKEWTQNYFHKF